MLNTGLRTGEVLGLLNSDIDFENRVMHLNSVGGIICAIVQILMEKTKLMPGRIMVMLVCTGALLGAVGIYGPFSKWAGAGANVPLLGFGNVLWKGVKEAVDSEGFIGLFKGGFKACAVGVSAALIFSYIAALITKPKLKS